MAADGPLLRLEEVTAGYEEVEVLRGVSLSVAAGHIVSIIGANGAGKSTLLRTVFGMVRPRSGRIRLGGEEIGGRPPWTCSAGASATCRRAGASSRR